MWGGKECSKRRILVGWEQNIPHYRTITICLFLLCGGGGGRILIFLILFGIIQ